MFSDEIRIGSGLLKVEHGANALPVAAHPACNGPGQFLGPFLLPTDRGV